MMTGPRTRRYTTSIAVKHITEVWNEIPPSNQFGSNRIVLRTKIALTARGGYSTSRCHKSDPDPSPNLV